jgi:SAM-dependent methyltransferase
LSSIDVASSKGLELGPLAKPIVRRDMGHVRYLDHVDTNTLRARYATHDGFDVDAIVPIDYVSANGSIYDAVNSDIPFDYVLASHVIEHVPDLIGWLRDIRSVLRDDGVLSLAIPDHRRCFDALRSPTVTADVIDAHLTQPTIPTPRQVFDHYSSAVAWHGYISWEEEPPFAELVPVHSELEALDHAAAAVASAEYQDVHCWVFTPSSFGRLFAAQQRLNLVPFSLERCTETVGGEFFATLRAAPPDTTSSSVTDGLPATASEHAALRAQLRTSQDELQRTLASRSWSITRPLRAFNELRARRR